MRSGNGWIGGVVVLGLAIGAGGVDAEPNATKVWHSSFEADWPADYTAYYPSRPHETATSGWDIIDADQAAAEGVSQVPHGDRLYKGWINGPASASHRAYPVVHFNEEVPSPFVNRFYVWLDWDLDGRWMHFLTLSNTADWQVVTMSQLGQGHLELAHVGPWSNAAFEAGEGKTNVGLAFKDMPLRQWVRFTVYMDFREEYDHMYAWKDGELFFKANGGNVDQDSEFLKRAHWGLYASGDTPGGVQYNDSIQIWTLDEPWTDFTQEPPSPWDGEGIDFTIPEPGAGAMLGIPALLGLMRRRRR